MRTPLPRRGVGTKQLTVLDGLRRLLRASTEPEEMLRALTMLLAEELGQYCFCDAFDRHGQLRRVVAAHADPARIQRLLAACDGTTPGPRVTELLRRGGSDLIAEVTPEQAETELADIDFLDRERVRSYVALTVHVNGSPFALLTLLVTIGQKRYDEDDLAFLEVVADWAGLGLENALRREAEPRFTTPLPGSLHVVDVKAGPKKRVIR